MQCIGSKPLSRFTTSLLFRELHQERALLGPGVTDCAAMLTLCEVFFFFWKC